MAKNVKSSSKRGKDVTKEVLKEDEKWYGLEKKFWSVVEFGVFAIILTFTAVAFGAQYNSLKSNNNIIIDDDSKQMSVDGLGNSFAYYVADICEDEECDTTYTTTYKGEDLEIRYKSTSGSTSLELGKTQIVTMNPLREFALLSNGYIATVEDGEGRASYIRYYNESGKEIKTYITYLNVTSKLDSLIGVYGTCEIPDKSVGSDQTLTIVEYSIQSDGSFVENIIGTFDNSYCKD